MHVTSWLSTEVQVQLPQGSVQVVTCGPSHLELLKSYLHIINIKFLHLHTDTCMHTLLVTLLWG